MCTIACSANPLDYETLTGCFLKEILAHTLETDPYVAVVDCVQMPSHSRKMPDISSLKNPRTPLPESVCAATDQERLQPGAATAVGDRSGHLAPDEAPATPPRPTENARDPDDGARSNIRQGKAVTRPPSTCRETPVT